jgi:hypothetical protein
MKYQAAILQSNGRTLSGNMLQDDEQYFEYGEELSHPRTIMCHRKASIGPAIDPTDCEWIEKVWRKRKTSGNHGLNQLHKRNCFYSIDVSTLTPSEKKQAIESLCFSQRKERSKNQRKTSL